MKDADPVQAYLHHARAARRMRARRAALVLTAGAIACGLMITRMTDIGHAVGFAALAAALLVGAGVIIWTGRQP